jgi:enoyl-CoA hydratase/carnithine racemase
LLNARRTTPLEVVEHERIIQLICRAVPTPTASSALAWKLIDACAAIEERDDLPVAVVLRADAGVFYLEPPTSAADCDAVDELWAQAVNAVARLTPPTVAAIDGDALGAAWELALACDLRVATGRSRFGSPEVRWNRMPTAGGTQRLARLVGSAMALRLLLVGEVVPAARAHALGLIDRFARDGELDVVIGELLADLRAAAPIALAYTKEAVRSGAELPFSAGLRLEADLAALLQTTTDRAEGIAAFTERRSPRFTGQ